LHKKIPHIVTVITTVLVLSILFSSLQVIPAIASSPSPSASYAAVEKHKISSVELQEYQTAAGTYEKGQNYNKLVGDHGTGLSPPTASEWKNIAENAYVVDTISYPALPSKVDLSSTSWFPPIGDQGQQGSCASFSIGYYFKSYQEAKEHKWNLTDAKWTGGNDDGNVSLPYQSKIMSPAFVYNLINGGVDEGSDFETPIRLVCNVGICSWQNMPYYWQDYQRWPTEAAWAEAPLYRSNSTYSYQLFTLAMPSVELA
jgi:hypothetical protein